MKPAIEEPVQQPKKSAEFKSDSRKLSKSLFDRYRQIAP